MFLLGLKAGGLGSRPALGAPEARSSGVFPVLPCIHVPLLCSVAPASLCHCVSRFLHFRALSFLHLAHGFSVSSSLQLEVALGPESHLCFSLHFPAICSIASISPVSNP